MSQQPAASFYPVATIAALLKLSPRRVQQLAQQGHLPKGQNGQYELVGCVQGYIGYLQNLLAGKGIDDDGNMLDLRAEQARLTRAKAISEERDNAIAAADLRPLSALQLVASQIAQIMIRAINALAGRLSARLAARFGVNPELIAAEIQAEADAIRTDVADGFERWAAGCDDLDEEVK